MPKGRNTKIVIAEVTFGDCSLRALTLEVIQLLRFNRDTFSTSVMTSSAKASALDSNAPDSRVLNCEVSTSNPFTRKALDSQVLNRKSSTRAERQNQVEEP
jgi:hypothetical protein